MELADFVATIVSPVLTIVTWLVTRELFAEFWKKWFRLILILAIVLGGIVLLWRIGWLARLQNQITWPVWGLLLYSVIVFCSPIGIFFLILYISDTIENLKGQKKEPARDYYTIYGARWYKSPLGFGFQRPPICANCLMAMRNLNRPGRHNPLEIWKCRECGHEIRWDPTKSGDLMEDVTARYNAELRRKREQDPWSVE